MWNKAKLRDFNIGVKAAMHLHSQWLQLAEGTVKASAEVTRELCLQSTRRRKAEDRVRASRLVGVSRKENNRPHSTPPTAPKTSLPTGLSARINDRCPPTSSFSPRGSSFRLEPKFDISGG